MKTNGLVACPECDALQRAITPPPRGAAECVRCGAELYRHQPHSLDRTLAILVAAAVVFVAANSYPLMSLDARGITSSTTLFGAAWALHEQGMTSVALLALATTIVFPAAQMGALLYMLVPLRLGFVPPLLPQAFRLVAQVRLWVMVDVFLLGSLVSLVKLRQLADVYPQAGIYAVGGYILLNAAAMSAFEPHEIWRRAETLGHALAWRERERAA